MSEVQMVDHLRRMVAREASDLHLTAGAPPRVRVDEQLVNLDETTLSGDRIKEMVYSLLTPQQIERFEREKELDMSFGIEGVSRYRVNVFMQRGTVAAAIRTLPHKIRTFEECGLQVDVVTNLCKQPKGLVLVTGSTGSGKSTTLSAMIQKINGERRCHIITVEDPIEYQLKGIGQMQVNPKIQLTFANGLRSILRQDPDVIMVGEIRDAETAEIAIHASLTGHLVFSTLHTNDSAGAIARLIDMGIEPFLVSSSVVAIVAQRLVRLLCTVCRESYHPADEERERLGLPVSDQQITLYRAMGCEACMKTGYHGRMGIYEILLLDDELRNLVMTRTDSTTIKQRAIEKGMKVLREDGAQKVLLGLTSTEEVLRVTQEEIV